MDKAKIAIIGLSVTLVISNCWWACCVYDQMITKMYDDLSLKTLRHSVKQCIRLLPVVANNSTQNEVIAAAQDIDGTEPFEKEGFLWVDGLGLKFDKNGRLIQVNPAASFDEEE